MAGRSGALEPAAAGIYGSAMLPKLRKVISGGQTGVDQAALRAAQDRGLDCGGWCFPDVNANPALLAMAQSFTRFSAEPL